MVSTWKVVNKPKNFGILHFNALQIPSSQYNIRRRNNHRTNSVSAFDSTQTKLEREMMEDLQTTNANVISDSVSKLLEQVFSVDWKAYYQMLSGLEAGFQVADCLKLLNTADALLNQDRDIATSDQVERFLVGGVSDTQVEKSFPFNVALLGGMQGFASFKSILKKDAAGLSKLLKVLPSTGPIDGWHFTQFVDSYQQLFENNGFKQTHLFPATRLLSMKRPDQFVALSDETNKLICNALDIKALKKQDFQRYWDDIILTVQKTQWFQAFPPLEPVEMPFHRVRVALLERLAATPIEISVTEDVLENRLDNIVNLDVSEVVGEEEKREESKSSTQFVQVERKAVVKKAVQQPKKLTIKPRVSAKSNKTAATKLMSQYYFANKAKFAKVDMAKHREQILDRIVKGESVETVFDEILMSS